QWRTFWNFDLSKTVRNVWFRTLHGKRSCRFTLATLLAYEVNNSTFPICNDDNETMPHHFLYRC
ncbi:hypothetical protein BDB00DRAFT_735745, partial [Zychaea mexicana]|uniref:uncharacterized protein n=1 Tax=Zychaea mexicana TaxID=64656 RepID=UPI0022FF19D9